MAGTGGFTRMPVRLIMSAFRGSDCALCSDSVSRHRRHYALASGGLEKVSTVADGRGFGKVVQRFLLAVPNAGLIPSWELVMYEPLYRLKSGKVMSLANQPGSPAFQSDEYIGHFGEHILLLAWVKERSGRRRQCPEELEHRPGRKSVAESRKKSSRRGPDMVPMGEAASFPRAKKSDRKYSD